MGRVLLACAWLVFLGSEIWQVVARMNGGTAPPDVRAIGTFALAAGFIGVVRGLLGRDRSLARSRFGRVRNLVVAVVIVGLGGLLDRSLPPPALAVVSGVAGLLLGAGLLGWTVLQPARGRSVRATR